MSTNTKQLNRQLAANKIRDDLAERYRRINKDPGARLDSEIDQSFSSGDPRRAQDLIDERECHFLSKREK